MNTAVCYKKPASYQNTCGKTKQQHIFADVVEEKLMLYQGKTY